MRREAPVSRLAGPLLRCALVLTASLPAGSRAQEQAARTGEDLSGQPPLTRSEQPDEAAAPLVERVDIVGNQFVQKETLLYYVGTKPGERYDERRVKDDFRRLWETGFLEDLFVDVRNGPRGGKIVLFNVRERPRMQIVDYRGSKALTTTAIEDEVKKKEAALRIDSFYDPAKARKVEEIIRGMLVEKGRPFATVRHDAKRVGGAGVQVSFIVDDGPKALVKKIDFAGNEVFSDRRLRRSMKKIKARGFWNLSWLTGKSSYTEEKWGEDQEKIREFYLNHGYVTATVGKPELTYTDGKSGLFKKKPVKWAHLRIPVTEGDQYRVGEIKFEGLTVFKEEGVRPLFKLQTGDVYKESRLKKGYDKLRDAYGAQGYFQWTGRTDRKPDPERKVVDLVIAMDEDKRYYVGRIRFTGNDTTRDKVIRREVYLTEGEVFNTELLKLSIRRINQLGYFKPMEGAPQLGPSSLGEDRIDVTFKVEEQNRNQFTFGGGVSGLEGTFVNASFSTANFLGLGETFQISAQSGRRTKNYQIAITEPYFLDRPITAGFDVYKRRLEYQTIAGEGIQGYIDDRIGASLVTGLPLGRFTRLFANYTYEIVKIENSTDVGDPFLDPTRQTIFNPFLLEDIGRRTESRLTPSLVYNTVDNPWTPHSGVKYSGTVQLAGGPLGGTLSYLKPQIETIFYIPHTRRTSLGLRGEVAWVLPYGGTARIDPVTGRDSLPFYQRYYLGGENQIRGTNIRAVGPRDQNNQLQGGNKYVLFNAEYYIDIAGPLRGVLFFDAGQAYLEGKSFDLKQLRTSTGAEVRFIMPVLNVPFRLIYAINPNRDFFTPRSTFKFAVGTTF
jgi:outer membrane protein insertion porin family